MMKKWCEDCEGTGYIEIPDYDWDENPIEPMSIECCECEGSGYINTKLCRKATQRLVGYTVESIKCEHTVYVVTLDYDDGDMSFETPVEAYYVLEDAVKYCEDNYAHKIDTYSSSEVIDVYKSDEYAYFKIYEVDIE